MADEKVLKVSSESQAEALKLAKGIQRPEQTKAQTKLVAQGIEKGIAEYKKQQKALARDRDKHRKKELKASLRDAADTSDRGVESTSNLTSRLLVGLPWLLLVASWAYFFAKSSFLR
ncbi:MAG: hypothetical protein ACI831_001477 [Candidatus Azotimanducaceae bacterium]